MPQPIEHFIIGRCCRIIKRSIVNFWGFYKSPLNWETSIRLGKRSCCFNNIETVINHAPTISERGSFFVFLISSLQAVTLYVFSFLTANELYEKKEFYLWQQVIRKKR